MNISLDAGGLCSQKQFGTYTFANNMLDALSRYDSVNHYTVYSFCDIKTKHPHLSYRSLKPSLGWMKLRVPLEEYVHKQNYYLALNSAIPAYTPSKIISFLHGLSFEYFKKYYPDSHSQLHSQLVQSLKKSESVIVSSQKIKKEIEHLYPSYVEKIQVLPFGIPFDMKENNNGHTQRQPYFVFCGMNHPIKNITFIVNCFQKCIADERFSHYELYLIGDHDAYKSKNIRIIKGITRKQLKRIYQQATAYLSASLYESFNLPALEALSQNCPVIGLSSAMIPEFNSYVHVVHSAEEFITQMKHEILRPSTIDTHKLSKQFSWERYINSLSALYL